MDDFYIGGAFNTTSITDVSYVGGAFSTSFGMFDVFYSKENIKIGRSYFNAIEIRVPFIVKKTL